MGHHVTSDCIHLQVCNDVKKNECTVVTKKKPQQVTRSVCPEDPDFAKYQEDEEEDMDMEGDMMMMDKQ